MCNLFNDFYYVNHSWVSLSCFIMFYVTFSNTNTQFNWETWYILYTNPQCDAQMQEYVTAIKAVVDTIAKLVVSADVNGWRKWDRVAMCLCVSVVMDAPLYSDGRSIGRWFRDGACLSSVLGSMRLNESQRLKRRRRPSSTQTCRFKGFNQLILHSLSYQPDTHIEVWTPELVQPWIFYAFVFQCNSLLIGEFCVCPLL